jgi:hypothetical protein
LPILLASFIVAVLCIFAEPVYQVNDDSFLAMVGGGFGVAVRPESHLLWSHIGYGLILNGLSGLVGPNAHGWMTVFSVWLSLLLVIAAVLRASRRDFRLFVLLICLGCVYLSAVLSAEFTVTSAVLFVAGIAMFIVLAAEETPRSRTWTAISILAIVLGYLIRPDSYLMGLAIIGPALIFLCWRRSKFASSARLLALILVSIALVGFATDKLAYLASPDWRSVPQYFDLATNFTDYNRVPWIPTAPAYRQVGWSFDDYVMFTHWYTRYHIYSLENVSLLVKSLLVSSSATAPARIIDWFHFAFTSWSLVPMLCGQALVWLLLEKRRRVLGLLLILGECGAISLAAYTGRVPLGYVWQAAADTTLVTLSALLITAPFAGSSRWKRFGAILLGLLGLFAGILFLSDHQRVRQDAAEYRAWIAKNHELLKGKVTVWDVGMMWEWLITPTRIYPPFPQLKVASIDDVNNMPIETAMLATLGIDDLAKELCTDAEMRLISPYWLVEHLTGFCERHYGIRPVFKKAAEWRYQAIYVLENPSSSDAAH